MTGTISTRVPRSRRFSIRATERQEQLIRRAAQLTDRTVTEFILDSVGVEAERILADRRWFTATEAQWAQFRNLLDLPLPENNKLTRLASRQRPFAVAA